MNLKRVALLALTGLLCFSLFAAGMTEKETGVTEIDVWFGRENFIPADKFERFHSEHPNIKVNYQVVRLEDVAEQLMLLQRAGKAPDIVQIQSHTVPQMATGGQIRASGDVLDMWKAKYPSNFNALSGLTWEAASHDGKTYGASLHNQSMYLWVRTDWLKEAGINTIPESMSEVLAAAKKISKLGKGIGFSLIGAADVPPVWELPVFMSLGGTYVDGVPQINSDAGFAWIEFYQTLMRDGSAHPDTLAWSAGEMRAPVIGGKAGMMIEGEHLYVSINENMPYEEGKWTFVLPPYRDGHKDEAVYAGFGFPYVLTSSTDKVEAAMEVLNYLSDKDIIKSVALTYQPSSNLEVSSDPEYLQKKPWAEDILPLFEKTVSLPAHESAQLEILNILTQLRQEMIKDPYADPKVVATKYQELLNNAAGAQ